MDEFVDKLLEDEAERNSLLAKPTCFIIVGKPGVGKSTLAKSIAESWKCILIDDTDLLNAHISKQTDNGKKLLNILSEGRSVPEEVVLEILLDKINSPEVQHYGYVLSCLPFISEEVFKIQEQIEWIKNLQLKPDFIIHLKCADVDLVQRVSGLKQHPQTGQLYHKDQWEKEEVSYKKRGTINEDGEEEDEQVETKQHLKEVIDQLVWTPENLTSSIWMRINMYNNTVVKPLEKYMNEHNCLYMMELDGNSTPQKLLLSVLSRLQSMAVKHVSIPTLLTQPIEEQLPEDIDTEELLRMMSSSQTVAPGFRWRRSRWGGTCPVALKEGKILPGKPDFCLGFQDKFYILSSKEAYQKFITNPRRYLLPPMPRPPCKVSIIGPPLSGKSTISRLLAQHYNAVRIDVEELLKPVLETVEQERLDKIREETTQAAVEKIRMQEEAEEGHNPVTQDHPDVQALVLSAVEEARKTSSSPSDLYAEVLQSRIKEIEQVNSEDEGTTGWVIDNFPMNVSQVDVLQQAGIQPDTIFCLTDTDGHEVLKRLYEANKESVDRTIKRRIQDEQILKEKQDTGKKEQESEMQSTLETVLEETEDNPEMSNSLIEAEPEKTKDESQAVIPQDHLDLGYPDYPEMNEYKMHLKQFMVEWERMQFALTVNHCVVEIGKKGPQDLLQEVLQHMEKPFIYETWELNVIDIEEESEDLKALNDQERGEDTQDSISGSYSAEEEEGDTTAIRILGNSQHFCPVALQTHNVLWPCLDQNAAKYREKTFYFSSQEAKDSFLQNPAKFVSQTAPLKPPALRIFMLGTRGSGKTTQGSWLAKKLGLFHIQVREQLQLLIMAKTKRRVPKADEVVSLEDNSEDLKAKIVEVQGMEDTSADDNNCEQESALTKEELAIKAYLSDGEPLASHILDTIVAPYWKNEPYKSTGFILEGFPNDPSEVQYMLQEALLPDVLVVLQVDVAHVQKRLLPKYLKCRQESCNTRKEQLNLLRDLRNQQREQNISKRRAELLAEQRLNEAEDEEIADDIEEEIEFLLGEEFPVKDDDEEDVKDEETEDEATERLEMEIEDRFATDEGNLAAIMGLLGEENLPILEMNASQKLQISQRQLLCKILPLSDNRESLFQRCQPITCSLAQKLLVSCYKFHSGFGCCDPVKQYKDKDLTQPLQWPLNTTYPLIFHQYIYFFASKDNRNIFMLNPLKYLRQPKPRLPLPVKIAIIGPPKSGKTTVAQMFAQNYGLERLSIGGAMRAVLTTQGHTNLALQMNTRLAQGLVVPDELAVQCLEVALMSPVCSIKGFVLDGFPLTLKQAELMGSHGIIPMTVVELELESVEILKRGEADKLKLDRPHLMHDNWEILLISNNCYQKEATHVRHHFQRQYQNWVLLDGLKSKWWIWDSILQEVSSSMKCMHTYLERTQRGQAACLHRLCVTPTQLESFLGEFGHYCPVCLALLHHLVDCSGSTALTYIAEYTNHYYKMCSKDHLETFLSRPDEFVAPKCPHTLPPAHLLPVKLTAIQVKDRFPQQVELKGFCPVTYRHGKQRYEFLVRGKIEYAAEYRNRIYLFESSQKQDQFMRMPEAYWDQKLPTKVPPLCEPVSLTSLPTLGYLEQGVGVAVIKALTAVGCLKPKYPFLSVQRTAVIYVAFYLKAFNPKKPERSREIYKRKLANFEENCALIPYLGSVMAGRYIPPNQRSAHFHFKLQRFLALADSPGTGP